jgi:hypothetical protein
MYQAIQVRFLAPDNRLGARVKAFAAAGSVTLHRDYELNDDGNANLARRAFCEKFGWVDHTWIMGTLPNGDRVFVVALSKEAL